jgi:HSP20 family protein
MPKDKRDPLQDLIGLRNRFMELVDRSFQGEFSSNAVGHHHWAPPVDFYENERELVIQIEIAGIDRDSIEIEFNGNQITIKGDRPVTFKPGEAVCHRLERQHGQFRRELTLPVAVSAEKIEATYDAGVLMVVLPIKSLTKERKIKVSGE